MTSDRISRALLLAATEGEDPRVHQSVRDRGLEAAAAYWARELDGEALLRRVADSGARLVIPDDDEWPTQLEDLEFPPWGLFVRGAENVRALAAHSVAIVGSRSATGYGLRVAADLAADLAERGWSVISGLAFGIDAAAHRGALAVHGPTAAVLAGGVDAIYPASHTELGERIMRAGAVISEVPPGVPPMRHRFLTRNRLIAALTRGTIVIEAARRSGSLRTAASAEALLRPVMALPGPITSAASAGTHRLIAERRAELVTSAADVLGIVGELGAEGGQQLLLAEREQATLAVLNRRGASADQIAARSGRPLPEVMASLGLLAVLGLASHRDGRWMQAS
jgi:DNA processing protein